MTNKEFVESLEFAAEEPFRAHNLINGEPQYTLLMQSVLNVQAIIKEYTEK